MAGPPNPIARLFFLLPLVFAIGVWIGNLPFISTLEERSIEYPLSLSSIQATVPEVPTRAAITVPLSHLIAHVEQTDPLRQYLITCRFLGRAPPSGI